MVCPSLSPRLCVAARNIFSSNYAQSSKVMVSQNRESMGVLVPRAGLSGPRSISTVEVWTVLSMSRS